MPKYKITEVDNTGGLTLSEQPNIVYIPGGASAKTEPILCKSVADLDAITGITNTDASYLLAKKLLNLGMQVLYQGFVVSSNAITISEEDWAKLEDKDLYNVRFLTTGAYACPSAEMIACAEHRGDCIALIDHEKPVSYDVDDIRDFYEDNGYLSKYAAGFTPWFTANLGGASDVEVPASFGYLLAFARSVQSNPLWKAVAGVFRGRIPEMVKPSYKYTSAECDKLQARASELDGEGDNGDFAINPICCKRYSGFAGGFNYVIYGNRTLLVPGEKGIQASNFLNVRALISEISKTLYDASITYTFEQNSDVLWINFKALITPLLDKMQSGEGIAGYRLDRLKTNKKARLCARITIVPIEAVEDFELEIYLEDSLDASLEVRG